jgi:hypothetical protein
MSDIATFLEFKWLYGLVGGAFFLILSWVVSNYLNWKVNNRVYKELKAIRTLLEKKNETDQK